MTDDAFSNNEARRRYEYATDRGIALAAYRIEGDVIAFTHTEVPEALEGRGIASKLIAAALADVRARGLKVRPLCAFVAHYMDKHRETHDLLA